MSPTLSVLTVSVNQALDHRWTDQSSHDDQQGRAPKYEVEESCRHVCSLALPLAVVKPVLDSLSSLVGERDDDSSDDDCCARREDWNQRRCLHGSSMGHDQPECKP